MWPIVLIHLYPRICSTSYDTGAMQSLVSYKLAAKLPAIVKTMTPLTVMLPTGKTIIATTAIQLDMLIDDFIYM